MVRARDDFPRLPVPSGVPRLFEYKCPGCRFVNVRAGTRVRVVCGGRVPNQGCGMTFFPALEPRGIYGEGWHIPGFPDPLVKRSVDAPSVKHA